MKLAFLSVFVGAICAVSPGAQAPIEEQDPLPIFSLPLRFDMGTDTSPVATGWIRVEGTDAYPTSDPSTTLNFGWTAASGTLSGVDRGSVPVQVVHNHDEDLLSDFNEGTGAVTFRLSVPIGTYHCMVYLGDVDARVEGMKVIANGVEVATDVFARTVADKASLDGAVGGYRRLTFKSVVPNNTAGLRLKFEGTLARMPIMGVEVFADSPAPLQFDDNSSVLTRVGNLSAANNVIVDDGIDDYNAGLYDDAVAHFLSIQPRPAAKLAKAYGLAFVVGALTNHMEQVDVDLLQEIIDTLAALDQDDAAVRNLYVEALDLQKGDLFNRTRAYTLDAFPENPESLIQHAQALGMNSIVLNLCAAVQLFEQMDDDILDDTPSSFHTESPFYPTARYLIARNYYSRNTKLSVGLTIGQNCNPILVELNTYWLGIILDELWPRLDLNGTKFLFPKAHEAITFCWFFDEYVDPIAVQGPFNEACPKFLSNLVAEWDGVSLPPGVNVADTWWAEAADIIDTTNAPSWAVDQRAYHRQFRNLANWWIENRLFGFQLGGGSGDDQEAAVLSVPSITRLEGLTNQNVEEPLNDIWKENLLNDPAVNVAEGYFNNAGDVEHAAEFTSNPLFILLPTGYGSPQLYEFSMRLIRNMEDKHIAGSPDAWMTPTFVSQTGPPARHFYDWKFGGGVGPPLNGRDIALNMKAIAPGFHLLNFNQSPTTQRLFEEWAWAWRDLAMRTDNNKPAGFFPPSVKIVNDLPGAIGETGAWWLNNAYASSQFPSAYTAAHYYLGVQAARASTELNKADLYDPLVSATNSLITLSGGDPDAAVGTEMWAVGKTRSAIATAAWLSKAEMLGAGINAAALDTAIDTWAKTMPAFLNANASVVPTNKAPIENLFEKAQNWMRHFWIFSTTSVTYTDRMKFDIPAFHALYTTPSGGTYGFTPNYLVTWFNPNSSSTTTLADELDMAVLVNRYSPPAPLGQLDVLINNFKSQDQDIGMRVWNGFGLGTYTVEIGPDSDGNDVWDSAPTSATVTLDFVGDEHVLTIPTGMHLIRFTQTAPASPIVPDFDLGLNAKDISVVSNTLQLAVHNLGLSAFDPGAGHVATVRLFVNSTQVDSFPVTKVIPSPEASVSGLDPSLVRIISPNTFTASPTDLIRVELDVSMGQEITLLNNEAELLYSEIPQL